MQRALLIPLSFSFAAAVGASALGGFLSERRVTFSAEQVEGQSQQLGAGKSKFEFWSPDETDVARVDALVAPRLASEIKKHKYSGEAPVLRDYYRQYIGIVRDGRRLIVANGFVDAVLPSLAGSRPADFWKRELTGAADGGCMFFHAAFDVSSEALEGPVCNPDPFHDAPYAPDPR